MLLGVESEIDAEAAINYNPTERLAGGLTAVSHRFRHPSSSFKKYSLDLIGKASDAVGGLRSRVEFQYMGSSSLEAEARRLASIQNQLSLYVPISDNLELQHVRSHIVGFVAGALRRASSEVDNLLLDREETEILRSHFRGLDQPDFGTFTSRTIRYGMLVKDQIFRCRRRSFFADQAIRRKLNHRAIN